MCHWNTEEEEGKEEVEVGGAAAEQQPPPPLVPAASSLGGGALGAGSSGRAKEASGSGELGGEKGSKPKLGLWGPGSSGDKEVGEVEVAAAEDDGGKVVSRSRGPGPEEPVLGRAGAAPPLAAPGGSAGPGSGGRHWGVGSLAASGGGGSEDSGAAPVGGSSFWVLVLLGLAECCLRKRARAGRGPGCCRCLGLSGLQEFWRSWEF